MSRVALAVALLLAAPVAAHVPVMKGNCHDFGHQLTNCELLAEVHDEATPVADLLSRRGLHCLPSGVLKLDQGNKNECPTTLLLKECDDVAFGHNVFLCHTPMCNADVMVSAAADTYEILATAAVVVSSSYNNPCAVAPPEPTLVDIHGHRFAGGDRPNEDYLLFAKGGHKIIFHTGTVAGHTHGYFMASIHFFRGCGNWTIHAEGEDEGSECFKPLLAVSDNVVLYTVYSTVVSVTKHAGDGFSFLDIRLLNVNDFVRKNCGGMLCNEKHEDKMLVAFALPLALALTAAAAPVAPPPHAECPTAPLPPGEHDLNFFADGRNRTVRVYVPDAVVTVPRPLIVLFHGYSNEPDIQAENVMTTFAAEKKVLLAAPRGYDKDLSWNGGDCCGEAVGDGIDDVAMFRQLVALLQSSNCVDETSIYATGYSNGGFFATRLACEASDILAGAGSVAGALSSSDAYECNPERKIPFSHTHGRQDEVILYEWGADGMERLAREIYGCALPAPVTTFSNGTALCEALCLEPYVELCGVDQGHDWPGAECLGSGIGGGAGCDDPAYDVSATERAWTVWRSGRD